ncbi:hypothetical protein BST95_04625 [Halioglobus japonicus]|uniref:TetR/AcrR family transcriptional regulator n=1 Tax=Halioglobus japonicus TaxID=930805 RepID=A0AAP8MDJ7_9GAMM|nr:TetR/AcrR family transcriptional regulator [Halioglobus japonicus]AQA17627.1 hypothetical protein BST95_04625 [Halioglobus japonicus]PLW85567.1 TetR/AcrR family transcriptional regulator [Halioglobus japonicus]GHD16309.1 TetR family transcriptional regulator [Halioglobus japonicus]
MNSAEPKLTLTQRKRLDILAAARTEFLETGFRDTSIDRAAERAQVSKRSLYNHFASKEALFGAIAEQFVAELQQAIYVEYDPALPLDEQLRDIAEREVAHVTDDDYVAVFQMFFSESESLRDIIDEMAARAGGHDPIATWISAAAADGRLAVDDPAFASGQFVALIKGPLFWPRVAGCGPAPGQKVKEAVVNGAVEMFLARYGKPA